MTLVGFTVKVPLLEATLLITRVAIPVFVTMTLSTLLFPRSTVSNGMVFRLSENPASVPVPVPLTTIVSGELDPV